MEKVRKCLPFKVPSFTTRNTTTLSRAKTLARIILFEPNLPAQAAAREGGHSLYKGIYEERYGGGPMQEHVLPARDSL